MPTQKRCLILAAHGSTETLGANLPLFDLAERIRQHDLFDVVIPAFLNGQPEMTGVLEDLARKHNIIAGDVVIVPIMTSEGYYLKKLPEKFAANNNAKNYRLLMTPVLGMHPSIPFQVKLRIDHLVSRANADSENTTVVIVGHGTRRNLESCQATLKLAASLEKLMKDSGLKFESAFLDQDPSVASVAANIQTEMVVIVPFLISPGPHVTQDIPQAFGLQPQTEIKFPFLWTQHGRAYWYDHPLAMYPRIDELCLELANEEIASGTPLSIDRKTPEIAQSNAGEISIQEARQ